ncbi:MAG: mannose-1-phosphate guanylyltransferase/mannose-6-phosphate isomerase [Campylobacterales bacterium]|nr:mannose-1-phosphate guanylyltransferase/mannose-6-phosphate isomerase [Campylobacterales bacterium]
MTNVVLCGGIGSRMWPISRTYYPKQFYKFEEFSLFQQNVIRNEKICSKQLVVSNEDQYFLASDQLDDLKITQKAFILESTPRDTSAAIALAALSLDKDEIMFVTPSDHKIDNMELYEQATTEAQKLANDGFLVTFGIDPNTPETGYGYIKTDGNDVLEFEEKPSLEVAQKYLEAGNYLWNSGMFMFKAGVYLDELKKYESEIYEKSKEAYDAAKKGEMTRIPIDLMEQIPKKSIDYAVMERSEFVKVVKSEFDWNDLGSFDALYEDSQKDENQNTVLAKDYIGVDSNKNLIYTNKTVATIDVDDLVVIDSDDALLISKRGSTQKIKKVVEELKEKGSKLVDFHKTVHRPWGMFTTLEEREIFKIKKIVVKPHKRLSLQKHYHRNEHWIVVSGTAIVTVDDKEFILKTNESTYIPMGVVHRLENPGKIPLVIIEAQVGQYLEEDDIVRIEDDFKRA